MVLRFSQIKSFIKYRQNRLKRGRKKKKNTDHLCLSFENHSETRIKEAAAVCAQQSRAAVTNASFYSVRSDAGL